MAKLAYLNHQQIVKIANRLVHYNRLFVHELNKQHRSSGVQVSVPINNHFDDNQMFLQMLTQLLSKLLERISFKHGSLPKFKHIQYIWTTTKLEECVDFHIEAYVELCLINRHDLRGKQQAYEEAKVTYLHHNIFAPFDHHVFEQEQTREEWVHDVLWRSVYMTILGVNATLEG